MNDNRDLLNPAAKLSKKAGPPQAAQFLSICEPAQQPLNVSSWPQLPFNLSLRNGRLVPSPVISGLTAHGLATFPIERLGWAQTTTAMNYCERRVTTVAMALMRNHTVMAVVPFALSCSPISTPPEVAKCEEQILANLANPESYERGQNDSLRLGERWQVGIEFTYIDESGKQADKAWQTCDFPIVDGKPDTSKFMKLESSLEVPQDSSSD